MRFEIGDIRITLIRESRTVVPLTGLFPTADARMIEANRDWLAPDYIDDHGNLTLSIHALVLESMGKTIVVDTCVGERPVPGYEALSNVKTAFLADFSEAGFDVGSIDAVMCTHLHFDHVGWNTQLVDGAWVPTFPNARYLFNKTEYEYWDAGAAGYATTFDTAVRPVMEAGLVDLIDETYTITDEIGFELTPGHSPGHMSVRLSSAGEEAIITGDMVHHPIQFLYPDWAMSADDDPARATKTRTAFRESYADQPVRIFGTHFGGTSCGHLKRHQNGYSFESWTASE